jgi:hypothetical protein
MSTRTWSTTALAALLAALSVGNPAINAQDAVESLVQSIQPAQTAFTILFIGPKTDDAHIVTKVEGWHTRLMLSSERHLTFLLEATR